MCVLASQPSPNAQGPACGPAKIKYATWVKHIQRNMGKIHRCRFDTSAQRKLVFVLKVSVSAAALPSFFAVSFSWPSPKLPRHATSLKKSTTKPRNQDGKAKQPTQAELKEMPRKSRTKQTQKRDTQSMAASNLATLRVESRIKDLGAQRARGQSSTMTHRCHVSCDKRVELCINHSNYSSCLLLSAENLTV